MENTTVERKGLFYGGGVGTYVFLGKTNCGKNYALKHAILHARQNSIRWDNVIVFSRTAKLSGDYDYLGALVGEKNLVLTEDESEIHTMVDHRRKVVEKVRGAKGVPSGEKDAYLRSTSILLILDDFAGVTNMSSSGSNKFFQLVSTSRHLHIWCCILCQYTKTIGPSFWQNCRAVMSFDPSASCWKSMMDHVCDAVSDESAEYRNFVRRWPDSSRHRFLIWWNFWYGYDKPRLPWIMHPLDMKKAYLNRYSEEDILADN